MVKESNCTSKSYHKKDKVGKEARNNLQNSQENTISIVNPYL